MQTVLLTLGVILFAFTFSLIIHGIFTFAMPPAYGSWIRKRVTGGD